MQNIYNNIHKISYDGIFYRRDIGYNYCVNYIGSNNTNIAVLASGNGTSIQKLLSKYNNSVKIIVTNNKNANIIEKAKNYNIPFIYLKLEDQDDYLKIINILRLFQIFILSYFSRKK